MLSWRRFDAGLGLDLGRASHASASARLIAVNRIVAPAAASVVVGLLLGAAAIFGVTLMVQQDTKPPLPGGDPSSSVLNRVEYGNRS
uniref:DUF2613 domain-containing protein n=1 Tax=Mycobacterium riyadhense TaxID=486698 RepID=A0A653ECV0_9MYCO|nr:hypothetical protein BIN_B_00827 [Mycobacterium riyadhense]